MRTWGMLLSVALTLPASVALAQVGDVPLTLEPRASKPAPAPAAATPAPAPGDPAAAEPVDEINWGGTVDEEPRQDQSLRHVGSVPSLHTVRSGDTLWDLCEYYFANPWEWPKIWSYNPTITNPHWIYPGDLVRLYPPGEGPIGDPVEVEPTEPIAAIGAAPGRRSVELRQVAFVADDELKAAGVIVGSPEEKVMLATGDEVYIEYPEGEPPQIGQRYAVFGKDEPVLHPTSKKQVGVYVRLYGEVKILEVKKGRKARGVVTYANDVIERGLRVAPTRTQYKEVAPVAPDKDLEGVVVAMLSMDHLIGEGQIVFIDRGADDGVKIGNQFRVVRRGDAYQDKMGPSGNVGLNDENYPDEAIGLIVIVEVGKATSVGYMVDAIHEIEIGDRVVMREAK